MVGRSKPMNPLVRNAWWILNDYTYPRLEPLSNETLEQAETRANEERSKLDAQIAALPENEDALDKYLAGCVKLLDDEDQTLRSIESRLTSVVGLSSIAGTIVFSGILALASGTISADTTSLRILMTGAALYLVLQICCATLASLG